SLAQFPATQASSKSKFWGGTLMPSLRHRMGTGRLLVLVVLLMVPALTLGQDYRGKVQGSITDSMKVAFAEAKVILRNLATGVEVTRQTNAEGHYIFDFVESGAYMIRVEALGFKKYEQQNIMVENRGDLTVDAVLEVGEVSEVVSVETSPVAVQFNSA